VIEVLVKFLQDKQVKIDLILHPVYVLLASALKRNFDYEMYLNVTRKKVHQKIVGLLEFS